MDLEKLAEKHLNEKLNDLGVGIPKYKHLAINLMVRYAEDVLSKRDDLFAKQMQIMKEKNILISVYSNGSGFLWSLMMEKDGTDLGWFELNGDCPLSETFTTYEKALSNAIESIGDSTLDEFKNVPELSWSDFSLWSIERNLIKNHK